MYRRILAKFTAALVGLMALIGSAQAEVALLMVEEPGCVYCARWNAEIAPIYPKTGEGTAAPLRRYDITNPLPSDIKLLRRLTFTPTFVLLVEGQETRRIEGYPGEDFFWALLGQMLEQEDIPFEVQSAD